MKVLSDLLPSNSDKSIKLRCEEAMAKVKTFYDNITERILLRSKVITNIILILLRSRDNQGYLVQKEEESNRYFLNLEQRSKRKTRIKELI